MTEQKNKTIADTFNSRIRTPWVWLVLAITVGLTILFYFSQKPEALLYSRYIKNLSEFELQESNAMRTMDRIRTGFGGDTVLMQAQTMTLREMAVSFSKEMDEIREVGVQAPPYSSVSRFEREVLSKVAGMRRYSASRSLWFDSFEKVERELAEVSPSVRLKVQNLLDSARAGNTPFLNLAGDPELAALPDSLKAGLLTLFQNNEELAMAWNRLGSDMSVVFGEDLIQFFQRENVDEISLKSKIPMAFYFLSLVLLLSTFFFIFHSRK